MYLVHPYLFFTFCCFNARCFQQETLDADYLSINSRTLNLLDWATAHNPDQVLYPPFIYRVVVDETNITHDLPYGHTGYYYDAHDLPLRCLGGFPNSYYDEFGIVRKFYKRQYTVRVTVDHNAHWGQIHM